jgi:hypothetical protein
VGNVDLNAQNQAILNGQSEVDVVISYHTSQLDANSGSNEIDLGLLETNTSQEVFARAENWLLEDCYDTTFFLVEIVARPVLELEEEYPLVTICLALILN